jgi:flagellar basal-body rod protein FlgF
MDRLIYTAATGARQLMQRQDIVAHNLANASTPGFRAETSAFRAVPVEGSGQPTRVFAVEGASGADLSPGPLERTGRELDVAVEGPGWIAVQATDGREAYTRNGSLQVSASGVLETRSGLAVLGEGGPISIPPEHSVTIARDGTLSAVPHQAPLGNVLQVGRIKLVNPPEDALARGADGLFRVRGGGGAADADPNVALAGGMLEGSNVNAAEALVSMISLARQFELQMKLLAQADDNARRAASLLNLNA